MTAGPEQVLWVAVLQQALSDLASADTAIRQDAVFFLEGPNLPRVLDLAGIDREYAPRLRVLAVQPKATGTRLSGRDSFGGYKTEPPKGATPTLKALGIDKRVSQARRSFWPH